MSTGYSNDPHQPASAFDHANNSSSHQREDDACAFEQNNNNNNNQDCQEMTSVAQGTRPGTTSTVDPEGVNPIVSPHGYPVAADNKSPLSPQSPGARWSEKDAQFNAGYNEEASISEGSVLQQFGASVRKNVTLKLRDGVSCCLEVFIPLLFVFGVIGIWLAVPNSDFPGLNILNQDSPVYTSALNLSNFCINSTAADAGVNSNPFFSDCNFSSAERIVCFPKTNDEVCTTEIEAFHGAVFDYADKDLYRQNRAVLDLDSMILLMLGGNFFFPFSLSEQYQSLFSSLYRFGAVHIAGPNSTVLTEFENYCAATSGLYKYVKGNQYTSLSKAFDFTELSDNEGKTWGAIELSAVTDQQLSAVLSFNRSGTPWTNTVVDRFSSGGLDEETFTMYYASGWLTWQRVVNEFYYNFTSRPTPASPVTAPMPYIAYTQVGFLQNAASMLPLLIVFSFLYPVSQQTKRIVEEKEKRIREAMMIMGLGSGSFYLSHWLTYMLLYTITSLLATILVKLTIFPKSDPLIVFFLYYFFCLSCISLATVFSSFFSKARMAALVSPILFFVISIPYFAVDNAPAAVVGLMCLMSPSAYAVGVTLIANYEIGEGMGSKEFASPEDTFNMASVFFFLIFDSVWYFLIALWFDNVLPSEWGTQESPCFCFSKLYKCFSGKNAKIDGEDNDNRDPNGQYEPEPAGKPSVQIRGLRKSFTRGSETFVAVNDLTFNLYEGQISVLLGHNGAGKTTAINLMTGMLEPDAGDCIVYGKSVRRDMRAVRQEIGFCPQHNILWDEMTCREHLEYFAKLKGLQGKEMEDAVLEMIHAVDLQDKLDVPSAGLSGGQKRKLSVAIAFVGRSRVVFLDEPTAGMDVGARRHTWELIKRMSVGRTIVLTTHYMDEADLLGNSIAIMSKGRLKCKGSSLFLKSRLGVGYTLNCAIEPTAPLQQIQETVVGNVPEAEVLSNVSGEISFRLPMHDVGLFPTVLAALESGMEALGVKSFGISVTTIEEVFLKLAHDEAEEVHQNSPANSDSQVINMPIDTNADSWFTKGSAPSLVRQFTTLFVKRIHNAKRDRRTQFFQILLPVICLLLAMLMALIKFPESPRIEVSANMYKVGVETAIADCNSNITNLPHNELFRSNILNVEYLNFTNATEFSLDLQRSYEQHAHRRTTAQFCGETNGQPYLMYNATGFHSAPEALQQYYRLHLKSQYGADFDSTIFNEPLRLSKREDAFFSSITTLIVGIFIMIPFTFIPSTFVGYAVKERECKAKHLQLISGMNIVVYWWANFVFDIISFMGTDILAILVFLIFNRKEYVGGGEEFGGIFILFLLYGVAGVAGAYLCSFPFKSHASAQNILLLGNFISGFVLVLLNYFLALSSSTESVGKTLKFVFRVIPSYCLGDGILNMASRELTSSLGIEQSVFDMDVLGWNLVYMAIEFPLFMICVMFLDSPSRQGGTDRLFYKPDEKPAAIENEDEDVAEERAIVESGRRSDIVSVRNLRKVYNEGAANEKVAVKNLSFGVTKGEVFGFLGTNGAGKTTSISILCGEQLPNTGRGFIAGHDVVEDAAESRREVGYCPQFDATLDLLNAEEHLRLYAGLRGVPLDQVDATVNGLIEKAGLTPHRYTLASNMSGGNRRKLSVAISLIGAPSVVFLDEPSAGMDPQARRGLWDTIQAVAAKCSVVLTTHHLEEVEALANRVAIMVNGELRCINTLHNLKTKFGSGFEMSVRVHTERDADRLRSFMSENFPQAVEEEYRQLKFTFALPMDTKLSKTFGLIEESKEKLGISDYSISQTSLEQVFLRIGGDAVNENMN